MSQRNVHARPRYHAYASPASPTIPQRALIRCRESPLARFDTQVSPPSRTTASPSRRRTVTLSGDGSAPSHLGASELSNPVVLEMRKGALLDVGNVLNQFAKMDKDVRAFCDKSADHIGKSKRPARVTAQSSALPENSPVGKPAHEFSNPEDYVFFALLSIITQHMYDDIFRPFHPAASARDSDRYEKEYLKMIDTSLQMQSAAWRSQKFSSIDEQVNADEVASLIRGFADSIVAELTTALEHLAGQTMLPHSFVPNLETILKTAYDWNRVVKKDILKYDYEPYFVGPFTKWNPAQMESFERLRTAIAPNTKVISSVSLGLISLGGTHVHRKARVLVEESFQRSRTMNEHPRSAGAQPAHPDPNPPPGNTAGSILHQPAPISPMSPVQHAALQARPAQAPLPEKNTASCAFQENPKFWCDTPCFP